MRATIAAMACLALATAGCGAKTLALPDDPIDKAATCAVVAAAHTRKTSKKANGVLPFEVQGRMLHYAMLTGASGDGFDSDKASAVTQREPVLEPKITGGKFETLVAPCAAAFPEAGKTSGIDLPADPFDRMLGCSELASFIGRAMRDASPDYGPKLSDYGEMRRRLDDKVALALTQHGAKAEDAQKPLKAKALAAMTRLGSPAAVMDQCLAAYPEAKKG